MLNVGALVADSTPDLQPIKRTQALREMQPFAMNPQDTTTKPPHSESSHLFKNLQKQLNETLSGYELVLTSPPLCPSLRLALIEDTLPTEALPEHLRQKVMAEPAYWAFCWASGQVLAAHILNNPQIVAGKTVVDFGAGSGVVGIAAKRAGAAVVTCCDNDPNAQLACQTNAALNGVEIALIDDFKQAPSPLDLVIAADVLYDRDNYLFLDALPNAASAVLIADSRIKNFEHPRYKLLAQQTATTWPDLEEYPEYNQVKVYASR